MMTKMKSRRFYKRKWWISIDFLAAFSTIIAKVIIEKSLGEVSLMGQDTIENVS